jgi:predicted DNA-binding protein YlxM (UPF0122 family)
VNIVDWKWVACYLDCEGTVGLWDSRGKKGGIRSLNWYNTHLESLQMMQAFMGVGNVGGRWRSEKSLGKKKQYALTISNKRDIVYALTNLVPFLVIKRQAAEELLTHLVENVDDTRARNFGKLLAIAREDYERWYIHEGKSLSEIATLLDATPSGVYRVLRLYDIETRIAGGAHLRGTTKSPETIARMKVAKAKMWEDPEFRASQIASMQAGKAAGGFRQAKGYTKPAIQGEKHPRSKLSDADTAAIRTRYAAGGISLQALAEEKHVSKKTILNIVQYKIRTPDVLTPV